MASKRWLDRVAVWGIGAAVPVVCVLGLWLLATARSHDGRAAGDAGAARGSSLVAALPFDATAPPAIELKRATRTAAGNAAETAPLAAAGRPQGTECRAPPDRANTRPAADPPAHHREHAEPRCAAH